MIHWYFIGANSRARRGDRRRPVRGGHPGDGRGTSVASARRRPSDERRASERPPVGVVGPGRRRRQGQPAVGDVRRGGWFVRITILVVVLIWLIPTLGVLITSFRPAELVNTTGWWTALAHPFRAAAWTLENYRDALDAGGLQNAFLNSLAVAIPSTVIPITIAAFAAYAFSWMEFRGRYVLFVAVVALLVVPAADGR